MLILVLYLTKYATMRYDDPGVISYEICNPFDTGYWESIYRYDILDSLIQSTNQMSKVSPINSKILETNSNQSNQSIKTDQSSASFERFI